MDKKRQIDYQKSLVENKFDQAELNYEYIKPESKTAVEEKVKDIEDFIASHQDFDSYSEEQKDSFYKELVDEKYVSLKDTLKEKTFYTFDITADEFNQLKNFVLTECPYDAGSIYYGIHLDATFFTRYNGKIAPTKVDILSGESILLYEILCKKTVTGIKTQSYMFASTLRKLAECAKIYNHYDEMTGQTWKKIIEWNMGLSKEKLDEVKNSIVKTMAQETVSEMTSGN